MFLQGHNHARIICEIANSQKIADLEKRCENWLKQIYVRSVLGIKLGEIRTGEAHRIMIVCLAACLLIILYIFISVFKIFEYQAKLWMRRPFSGSVPSTDPILEAAGVHFKTVRRQDNVIILLSDFHWSATITFKIKQWNFGTDTDCNGENIPKYQVSIPISDVFWSPPVVDGAVNNADYTPTVPDGVEGDNFLIDLFGIRQWALDTQK